MEEQEIWNNRDMKNLEVGQNPAVHPGFFTSLGSLLEDLGIAKIAFAEESHVPFDVAMNGTTISFLVPDWIVWSFIAFSIAYSAIKVGLV